MGLISRARINNFAPRGVVTVLFFLFFAALLVTRRTDCLQNPQFWAEEGRPFFVEAFSRPAWMNLPSYAYGYFDLLLRLQEQIAASVPLRFAPALLIFLTIAIQAAVPTFVISSRCENWMGPFPVRLCAALLYCGMPNSFEVHCIPLHGRVHLAVLAALILVSAPPRSFFGKLTDATTLTLSGLSGPFVLLLAPVSLVRYRQLRSPDARRNCRILMVALALAIIALLGSIWSRLGTQLGASFLEAIRIVGGQLAIGFFLGGNAFKKIVDQPWFDSAAVSGFILLLILSVLLLMRGKSEVRLILLIGLGALLLALAAPIGGAPGMTQWHALATVPGNGQRYFFLPMAMLLFALAAVAGRDPGRVWRGVAGALLLLVAIGGVRGDWVLPPFSNQHFPYYADLYRSLPPGASISIPLNPPGWEMQLTKPPGEK